MYDNHSNPYWLLTDHLGSTMKSVKASDGATTERRYRAWGEARVLWIGYFCSIFHILFRSMKF